MNLNNAERTLEVLLYLLSQRYPEAVAQLSADVLSVELGVASGHLPRIGEDHLQALRGLRAWLEESLQSPPTISETARPLPQLVDRPWPFRVIDGGKR